MRNLLGKKSASYGWIDFMNKSDADAFKAKYTEENPLKILGRTVFLQPSTERTTRTNWTNHSSEMILRYTPEYESVEEAKKLVEKAFPGAKEIYTSKLSCIL